MSCKKKILYLKTLKGWISFFTRSKLIESVLPRAPSRGIHVLKLSKSLKGRRYTYTLEDILKCRCLKSGQNCIDVLGSKEPCNLLEDHWQSLNKEPSFGLVFSSLDRLQKNLKPQKYAYRRQKQKQKQNISLRKNCFKITLMSAHLE